MTCVLEIWEELTSYIFNFQENINKCKSKDLLVVNQVHENDDAFSKLLSNLIVSRT